MKRRIVWRSSPYISLRGLYVTVLRLTPSLVEALDLQSLYYLRRRRTLCCHFGLFVCLSVRRITEKSYERILTKFLKGVGHGPGTKWLNFGDDPDHSPDPGVRSPKSGFTGLSKKYLVDSDQSCTGNLHCKNHSAILLCWRSAEVCALWVLLVANVCWLS